MTSRKIINSKLKEAVDSVLPITLIVAVLCFFFVPVGSGLMLAFLVGAVMLILGMGLFTLGAELSMTQMGNLVGAKMTKSRRLWLILVLAFVLGVVITIVAFRLIPREFIRMMGLWIMRIVYRSRIIHQDRIPEDGGAVIVSNHVTYGDALFLSLICPRPIRFIVAEEFVAIRWLGWILQLFNCLAFSSRIAG